MIERQIGGVAGMVGGAFAEQHRDAVGDVAVDVVLDEAKPRAHLEQIQHRDALLGRPAPRGHGRGSVEVEHAVRGEQATGGMGDRFGGTPRDERRVGVEPFGRRELVAGLGAVPLGDDLTALQHHHREGDAVFGGALEDRVDV